VKQRRVILANPEPQSSPSILHANEVNERMKQEFSGVLFSFADLNSITVAQRYFTINQSINQN